jgi:hypothetical protein
MPLEQLIGHGSRLHSAMGAGRDPRAGCRGNRRVAAVTRPVSRMQYVKVRIARRPPASVTYRGVDLTTAIVTGIQALAWPVAVFGGVWLLRREIPAPVFA